MNVVKSGNLVVVLFSLRDKCTASAKFIISQVGLYTRLQNNSAEIRLHLDAYVDQCWRLSFEVWLETVLDQRLYRNMYKSGRKLHFIIFIALTDIYGIKNSNTDTVDRAPLDG